MAKRIVLEADNLSEVVGEVVEHLRAGAVIGAPSDTVYGLLAPWGNEKSLLELIRIKDRGEQFICLLPNLNSVLAHVDPLTERRYAVLAEAWPGPLTAILPVRKPDRWGGADQAFRVPDNEFLAKVIESFGEPVLSTSANRKGEPPARSGQELEKSLGNTLPLIVDAGPSEAKEPSTLVRWIGEKSEILRVGAYPTEGLLDPPSEAP